MKTKRITILLFSLTLAAGALGVGCGQHHPGPGEPDEAQSFMNQRVDDLLDELQVDGAQRAAVLEVKDRVMQKMMAQRESHKNDHVALVAALTGDQPVDAKALHAKLDQKIDEHQAFAHELLDAALEVREVLTPEQRLQVREHAKQHMARRLHHRGPFRVE